MNLKLQQKENEDKNKKTIEENKLMNKSFPTDKRRCPNCGEWVSRSQDVCPYCGTPLPKVFPPKHEELR